VPFPGTAFAVWRRACLGTADDQLTSGGGRHPPEALPAPVRAVALAVLVFTVARQRTWTIARLKRS
jgi:hypothetical protein